MSAYIENRNKILEIVRAQTEETVKQSNEGITGRLTTITCPCGRTRGIMKMYQCLYCGIWYCEWCAEKHFGKTRRERWAEVERELDGENKIYV